jgi:uncharacterized alpha-E superfamily protein
MMLSRTADHLYWMSRQTERAENLARMLDIHYRHSLLPHTSEEFEQQWTATLLSLGQLESFQKQYGDPTAASAFRYLAFDRENPGSIVSCLGAARENARAVRGSITSEMWETLNTTWLDIRSSTARATPEIGPFLEWVRYRAHLSRGVTLGTMLRDDAFQFTRLGTFLEGADGTARMLLARAQPGTELTDHASVPDSYAWTLLLRSLSAFEVYRKVYRDAVTPRRVAELLILRDDLPRSLHRCLLELHANLKLVGNQGSSETERRAGAMYSTLRYGRLEDLCNDGLRTYLQEFLGTLADLSWRIARDFLLPATAY